MGDVGCCRWRFCRISTLWTRVLYEDCELSLGQKSWGTAYELNIGQETDVIQGAGFAMDNGAACDED
jgi:hypothetical protein